MTYILENAQIILGILGSTLALIITLNEKVRNLLLTKLNFSSSKSRLKKETSDSTDSMIESMINRINSLGEEFVKLSVVNTETQKENYELKNRLSDLEYECEKMKRQLTNNCTNNCFDV